MKSISRKIILVALGIILSNIAVADVVCQGEITQIYKWNHETTFSIQIEGANRVIRLPTKSDESIALTAYAMQKKVIVKWVDQNVTSCTNGWTDNTILKGWIAIRK